MPPVINRNLPSLLTRNEILNQFAYGIQTHNYHVMKTFLEQYPAKDMIYYAIKMNEFNVFKCYIYNDQDFKEVHTFESYYLLHFCVIQKSHEKFVKFLIKQGANVNGKSVNGITPLHTACYQSNYEMVRLFCEERKTNLNAINCFKQNAFNFACANGNNLQIVKLLTHTTINKNMISTKGDSAFASACRHKAHTIVAYLYKRRNKLMIKIDTENKHIKKYKKRFPEIMN